MKRLAVKQCGDMKKGKLDYLNVKKWSHGALSYDGYFVIHINMQFHDLSKAQWNYSKEIKYRRKETNKKGENTWRDHGNSISESGEERNEW